MITTRELAQMRSDVAETLVSTCRIERASGTVDSYGVNKQIWGTAVASAACRIDPYNSLRDTRGVVAERENTRTRYQATFEWDADITEGDRVIFGSDTLELIELQGIHSDRIVTRAILAKIEGE